MTNWNPTSPPRCWRKRASWPPRFWPRSTRSAMPRAVGWRTASSTRRPASGAAFEQMKDGRLERARPARGIRRPGPALRHGHRGGRDVRLGQHGVQHVPGPDPWRDLGDPRPWLGGAEGDLSAEDGGNGLDRHDEPDRAPLRHRSGADPHQGRAAGRRHLPDHRAEDLHLGRRSRHGRERHPSGAGQGAGRRRGHQGDQPVHRAQDHGEGGRQPRRAQRASRSARSKRRWASTATPPA